MAYSALAIVNYFIEKSIKEQHFLTQLHLIKMTYLAHAVYFKTEHEALFSDPVVAWKHGPVIVSIYDKLKCYGNSPVSALITTLQEVVEDGQIRFQLVCPKVRETDQKIKDFLDLAWKKLSTVDAWRLRMYSHEPGGAWYETVKEKGIDPMDERSLEALPRNLTILDNVIEACGR